MDIVPIREATIDDTAAIAELIRPLARKHIACEFSPEGARNLLASMEPAAIRQYLDSGLRYHVAEENGTLAGIVGVRDNAHLYHLFVAEPFQRQGLARRLWHVARDACLAAGNEGEFTVNSSSYAIAMYRKFGFIESGPPKTEGGVTSIPMKLPNSLA